MFHLQSDALVCVENNLFIVVIVPILDKQLIFIFQYDLLLKRLIEYRYKHYKINIR